MEFPSYEKFGFRVADLPLLFQFLPNADSEPNFYFGDNKFVCDCRMEPVFEVSDIFIQGVNALFVDFPNFTCPSPPNMVGVSGLTFLNQKGRDELVCKIAQDNGCPQNCTCIDQPSRNIIKVTCHNIDKLPDFIPSGISKHVNLYLSGNEISAINPKSYFDRIETIDISRNKLTEIPDNITRHFDKNVIKNVNLTGNNLKRLPKDFSLLSPVIFSLDNSTIECKCENMWIAEWQKRGFSTSELYCLYHETSVLVTSFDFGTLKCGLVANVSSQNMSVIISLSLVSLFILSIVLICIHFRTEMRLILRQGPGSPNSYRAAVYDIYISYDDNERDLVAWIQSVLKPYFRQNDYSVFDPNIDILPGNVRENAIVHALALSKSIIVLTSHGYLEEENKLLLLEFTRIVHAYTSDKAKCLMIIDYDRSTAKNKNRYIVAFRRLRKICIRQEY